MTTGLEIRLFGGLEIRHAGEAVTAFVSNKAPALLAYLAVTQRPCQRDALAALFWGEMGDADAKNNLRQALTSLRKTLEPCLDINRDTVALRDGPSLFVDVPAFLAAVRRREADPAADRARLQRAVDLYRGDFLEGFLVREAPDFEDWVIAQRTRYRELAFTALHDLVDMQMAAADYGAAIDVATHLLALDPWREEAHRQLMLALARTGRRSAALAAYEQCRRILREVFDATPGDETEELAAQIRMALRGQRHNLPTPTDEFVGRTEELQAVRRLLAIPAVRLLTLTGPGGVGKTRLALQAAQERLDYHLGGVWFVSLVPVVAPDSVAPAIAEALHLPPVGAESPLAQLANYLRDRDALLILDDFEHVVGAASLDAITRLLAAAPQLRIVVTSRTRLHLRAEHVLEVGGLSYPADAADPAAGEFAAVQLFVQRARQHGAFRQGEQDRAMLARICQVVDGMPLALELAAAWTRALAPEEILAEIEQGIDFLSTTQRDAAPRHRSMRAVFAASWEMLATQEQRVFAAAAVFRGGFDARAAQTVAGATPALLASLADKSFLRRDAEGRYRRHPLLLQFAGEQLQSRPDLAADAARRHGEWFGRLLADADSALHGADQAVALAHIRRDLDNVRQAWRLATERRDFAFFAQVLDPLMFVFDIGGLSYEACDLCRAAHARLAAAPGPCTPAERITLARVMALEGSFEFRVGNFAHAKSLTEEALAALLEAGAPAWNRGHVYTFLGGAYFGLGDLARTLQEFERALAAYTAAGSAWGIGTALGNIAEMHLVMGNEVVALDIARRAHVTAEPTGNAYLLTHNAYRLAVLLANAGDYAAAQRYQQESLRYARQLEYQSGIGLATASLGDIAFAAGDCAAARDHFVAAVELHREAGNWMDEARYLVRAAEAALAMGEHEACRDFLHDALRKASQAEAGAVQLDALLQVARLWLAQGRVEAARPVLECVVAEPASATGGRAVAVRLLAEHGAGASLRTFEGDRSTLAARVLAAL
jgi:DNA-binding SARP family transcriptional activator